MTVMFLDEPDFDEDERRQFADENRCMGRVMPELREFSSAEVLEAVDFGPSVRDVPHS
jgi:hypothetical protein